MKIFHHLKAEHIFLDILLPDKDAVLRFIADSFVRTGLANSADGLYFGLKMRENLISTGIGGGLCVPHAFSPEVKDPGILFMKLKHPINFEAVDALPVDIVFGIVVPENQTDLHLQILAASARLFRYPKFLMFARKTKSVQDLLQEIKRIEESN